MPLAGVGKDRMKWLGHFSMDHKIAQTLCEVESYKNETVWFGGVSHRFMIVGSKSHTDAYSGGDQRPVQEEPVRNKTSPVAKCVKSRTRNEINGSIDTPKKKSICPP